MSVPWNPGMSGVPPSFFNRPDPAIASFSEQWWLELPSRATPIQVTFTERLFGPMYSHTGTRLGLIGRLLYGWFITADPYFDRVDQELRYKGQ